MSYHLEDINSLANREGQLLDVFRCLISCLDRNNQILEALLYSKQGKAIQRRRSRPLDEAGTPNLEYRPDKVHVEILCSFVKIADIDTVNQNFEAEIFIQARWQEPALRGFQEQDLEEFDGAKYWLPHLQILNVDTEFSSEKVSYSVSFKDEKNYNHPCVVMFWRFRAVFRENLELQNFPVDVQDLTIQISTERSVTEIELVQDRYHLSTVNVDSFMDAQEWNIYNHVEVCHDVTTQEHGSPTSHPVLHIQCRVRRKVGYFIWNVVFIMFLIVSLTFAAVSIDPSASDRLAVTITLMLTAIAFKLVVKQSLPTISYLTHLDVYVLAALIFLCLHAAQNACVIYLSRHITTQDLITIDKYSVVGLAGILILFHIVFGIHIFISASKKRRLMKHKDREYQLKKNFLEKYGKLPAPDQIVVPKNSDVFV